MLKTVYNEPRLNDEQQKNFFDSIEGYNLDLTLFQNPINHKDIVANLQSKKIQALKW